MKAVKEVKKEWNILYFIHFKDLNFYLFYVCFKGNMMVENSNWY